MHSSDKLTLVIGLGEVGRPLYTILRESDPSAVGVDITPTEITGPAGIMHVCFPFIIPEGFREAVASYAARYRPEIIVINSTVVPGTTKALEKLTGIPCVYSPVRGKHTKMAEDLRFYVKFVAGQSPQATERVKGHFEAAGLKSKTMTSPEALELAKLLETTYFGLLIAWAQEMNRFSACHNADYFEVGSFFEEIAYLPRVLFKPGVIGGHCVMQNIELLSRQFDSDFWIAIKNSNNSRRAELNTVEERASRERLEPIKLASEYA